MRPTEVETVRISVLIAAATLGLPAAAHADAGIDTRVTFTIADDDLLKGPEDSKSDSPSVPNSLPENDNKLFFDNFDTRDSGFENLTHLVIYTHQPGFFAGLDTEAALVIRAQLLEEKGLDLREDGSYVKLSKQIGEGGLHFDLTAFPISADRFRLGYSYDISWGGSEIFRDSKATPGLKLDLASDRFYAFLGAKTGLRQQKLSDGTTGKDTVWGVLGGGGFNVLEELRLEANAGYFYRGTFEQEELQILQNGRFETAPWLGYGGSVRINYHVGMPIGTPIDFRLYKNDPLKREEFFKKEAYDEAFSFGVSGEMSFLGQTLQDPDRPNSTTIQPAVAAALTAKFKVFKARFQALAVYRDMAFILYNVPSLASFVDFPDGIEIQPEYFFSVGGDYYFESLRLTPGVMAGLQRPANATTTLSTGNNPPITLGQQTVVVRDEQDQNSLNPGTDVLLVFAAKATLRWDLSQAIGAILELQYSHDPNRTKLLTDPSGISTRVIEDPNIFGFNLMLQARF